MEALEAVKDQIWSTDPYLRQWAGGSRGRQGNEVRAAHVAAKVSCCDKQSLVRSHWRERW
jgi:hypothetical protein